MVGGFVGPQAAREWRAHWPVVSVSMAGFAVAQIHLYSLGAMIAPLEEEFQWSRVQISSGLFILSIIASALSPFMGMLVDRLGPRPVALVGIPLYALALSALSLTGQAIWTWWALWVLVACTQLFLNPAVWITAVSSLFSASRGLALAVATCSTGLMAFIAPWLTYKMVENFGWRSAYQAWGVIAAAIAFPLIFMAFRSAHNRTPGAMGLRGTIVGTPADTPLKESLRSRPFVHLAVAALIMATMTLALSVNIIPILSTLGFRGERAAAIAGLIGLSQIVGRLSGGLLLDRLNARYVGGIVLLMPILTVLILNMHGVSTFFAIIAVLVFGLSIGAEMDIIGYLAARFFPIEIFGTVFGIIVGLLAAGNGIGPLLANWIYDLTGSYSLMLWIVIPMAFTASALLLSLGSYPAPSEQNISRRAQLT